MSITGVSLGFVVGAIPSASMVLTSWFLSNYEISNKAEAAVQNFAAGLIIAAVSAELVPLLLDAPRNASLIGITVGFALGLSLLHGLENVISYFEDLSEKSVSGSSHHTDDGCDRGMNRFLSQPEGLELDAESGIAMIPFKDDKSKAIDKHISVTNPLTHPSYKDWDDAPLDISSKAFAIPDHRNHILDHMREVANAVADMEHESNRLLEDENLTLRESEQIAETIDENIHSLQYKLDHCRRLIQGSETEMDVGVSHRSWVTDDRKIAMKQRLRNLKLIVDHVIEHINESKVDGSLLREIYVHMDQMEHQINVFHTTVATVSQKWSSRNRPMMTPKQGDTLPVGLVIPVVLDCFVDGFLIGVTSALSPGAAYVLGAAGCLEMGFLGMAYAARITRCTGSTPLARTLALYGPPMFMFLSAGIGAALGTAALSIDAVYVSFVAFGVVALLSLVCNELLIEAKAAQGNDERWYIAIMIFAGIYVVFMCARLGV